MRLTSSVRRQAVRLMLSAGARSTMPAQLTRMSIRPISATTAATTASTLAASATLQVHAVDEDRAAARALTASPLRSRSASRAPFAAKASAIAAPMPEAAPVTTATLPAMEKSRSIVFGAADIGPVSFFTLPGRRRCDHLRRLRSVARFGSGRLIALTAKTHGTLPPTSLTAKTHGTRLQPPP